MNVLRRFFFASGALLIMTAGLFCSAALADAAPAAPLQEEMRCLTASQLAEEENLTAILWVQRSAEFRGLSYQAYNLAAMEVGKAVAQRREKEKALGKAKPDRNMERQRNSTQPRDGGRIPADNEKGKLSEHNETRKLSEQKGSLRPLAVVLDIDDTIVCHANLEAYYAEHPEAKADYDAWEEWIARHNLLLPGAADFLRYADKSGVQVFYVTGRGPRDKNVTEAFLQKAGLPFPDESHLLMNDGSGGKMNHFAKLARRYDIICYLGDNVADFPIGAVRDENAVIYKKDVADTVHGSSVTAQDAGPETDKPANAEGIIVTAPDNASDNASEAAMQSGKRRTEMPLDIPAMLKHDKNAARNRIVDTHKNSFGTAFILLPNPMYGDWEYNLAKNFRRLPAEQRIALRKAALKSFAFKETPDFVAVWMRLN